MPYIISDFQQLLFNELHCKVFRLHQVFQQNNNNTNNINNNPSCPCIKMEKSSGWIDISLHVSCFNDDLLEQLTKCHVGFKMLTMNVCCPTVADDMVLLALSVVGLLCLLCICYAYSCKWRYEYSASKCSVIVYNENKYDYKKLKKKMAFW